MNIQDAKLAIRSAMFANDTVIMEGAHGIGKSEIVKQFAKEENMYIVDLRLSNNEVGDLIGIPHIVDHSDGSKITEWSVPSWLKRIREHALVGVKSVLFLDELNRAPTDVRQSALQLVLDKQIHEHHLPEGTMIVSAINPADEYQVDELDPALLDRFLFLQVEVDAPSWLKWARESGVNQIVCDFIAEFPDRLHWTPADGGVGATPRSWSKLGSYMDNIKDTPEIILFQIMKGKIGTEIGSQFYSFVKNYVDVVKMADIEQIVKDNKDEVTDVEEMADLIKVKTQKAEAIHKSELAHQLASKYANKKDMMPFLAFLYSLETEICIAFLKGFRSDEPKLYKNLVQFDTLINDKNLFKRIVKASDKE